MLCWLFVRNNIISTIGLTVILITAFVVRWSVIYWPFLLLYLSLTNLMVRQNDIVLTSDKWVAKFCIYREKHYSWGCKFDETKPLVEKLRALNTDKENTARNDCVTV